MTVTRPLHAQKNLPVHAMHIHLPRASAPTALESFYRLGNEYLLRFCLLAISKGDIAPKMHTTSDKFNSTATALLLSYSAYLTVIKNGCS